MSVSWVVVFRRAPQSALRVDVVNWRQKVVVKGPQRHLATLQKPCPSLNGSASQRFRAFRENRQVSVVREDAITTEASQFTSEADVHERRHSLR